MKNKTLSLFILSLLSLSIIFPFISTVHATSIAQSITCGAFVATSVLNCIFNNNTTSGNIIVAICGLNTNNRDTSPTVTITDSQSNTYTPKVSANEHATTPNAEYHLGQISTTTTSSNTADTITCTEDTNMADTQMGMIVFELSSGTLTGLTTASGTGTSASPTTSSSLTFNSGDFLGSMLIYGNDAKTVTGESGFTFNVIRTQCCAEEHATSGATSPSSFSYSSTISIDFADVAIKIPNANIANTRTVSDLITQLDVSSRTFVGSRTPTDTGTITDTSLRTFNAIRTSTDSPSITDIITRLFTGSRTVSDSPQVSDTITKVKQITQTISESLQAFESWLFQQFQTTTTTSTSTTTETSFIHTGSLFTVQEQPDITSVIVFGAIIFLAVAVVLYYITTEDERR